MSRIIYYSIDSREYAIDMNATIDGFGGLLRATGIPPDRTVSR